MVGGKFGKFGESSMIRQNKPSKLVPTINNLWADLLIHQTFFTKCLKRVSLPNFPLTKLSCYMVDLTAKCLLKSVNS